MLSKINIRNYALIDQLEIDFESGFSVLTGETGAGKSIILGALGLTLGDRVDSSSLNDNNQKCVIETWFNIGDLSLDSFFEANELDYEVETIVRREILVSGKSRAFINDTPVSLQILKELSSQLIDVHSQHQTLLLNQNHFQLNVVDTNAKNQGLTDTYRSYFIKHSELENKLNELREKENKLKSDRDYFQFQFEELEKLNLSELNEENTKEELDLLNNSEEIKSSFSKSISLLDNEMGVVSLLKEMEISLLKISSSSSKTKEIQERLSSAIIELQDLQSEIESTQESITFDEERIEFLTERLSSLFNLYQKHNVESVEDLTEVKNKIENNLILVDNFDDEIFKHEQDKEMLHKQLVSSSDILTKSRRGIIPNIEKEVNTLLSKLGMEDAEIKIELSAKEEFNLNGRDTVQFLFKANKGGEFNSIQKVASGGELSRLMLCIKANLGKNKNLPTLIFDEIDSGVSGDIASKMGEVLGQISKRTQVICITHLPQIASKGNAHYKVFKVVENGKTYTRMSQLDSETRVVELAKMLSGSSITDAALANAKSLLSN